MENNLKTIQQLMAIRNDIAGRINITLQYLNQLNDNGKDKFDIENESDKRRHSLSIERLSRQFEAIEDDINSLIDERYGLNDSAAAGEFVEDKGN